MTSSNGAMAALLLALFVLPAQAACDLERGPSHTVARIVDVETLALDDGREVRLAGILVPRADDVGAAPGTFAPEEAARTALTTLVLGASVTLWFDARRDDRLGRRLAHVVPANAAQSVQHTLLSAGHARVEGIVGQRACLADHLAAEAEARSAGRGLWREAAYHVRPARPARALNGFAATFQILTGEVHTVISTPSAWLLRLGPDRRRDVTIKIRTDDRDTLGRFGGDPKALVGTPIEARGWLTPGRFGGFEIDLSTAGHMAATATPAIRPHHAKPRDSSPPARLEP